MDQVNNNLYSFSGLPEEVTQKILSNLDLETQYKVSNACKSLYQSVNTIAEENLKDKFITRNGESATKQLADHLRLYCKVLNSIFKKTLTPNLFTNVSLLEGEAKADPTRITQIAKEILFIFEMHSKLPILIEAGARFDDLGRILIQKCPTQVIQQVLNKQLLSKIDSIYDMKYAFEYPDDIKLSCIDRLVDINDFEREDTIYSILSNSYLPDSTLLKFIEKIRSISAECFLKLYYDRQLHNRSESVLMALLDHLDTSTFKEDEAKNLAVELWDDVIKGDIKGDRFSIAILKKLHHIYSSNNITFELKFNFYLLFSFPKFLDDELILSLLKTQTPVSREFLAAAIQFKFSPEVVLKIYEKVPREDFKDSEGSKINQEAMHYLFTSGSYDVIFDLIQSGEYPSETIVEDAISHDRGESIIKLLSEAKRTKGT